MNEVELIRSQLKVEKQHAAAVARALVSAFGTQAFREAGVDYLAWILSRFEEREQLFHDLLRKRLSNNHPERLTVEAALAQPGSSREALAKLEGALGTDAAAASASWQDFVHFYEGAWTLRREEIDRLFATQAKVTDWRTVSNIDADSIVAERNRYARVKATLPSDIEMSSSSRL